MPPCTSVRTHPHAYIFVYLTPFPPSQVQLQQLFLWGTFLTPQMSADSSFDRLYESILHRHYSLFKTSKFFHFEMFLIHLKLQELIQPMAMYPPRGLTSVSILLYDS